jgi:hypothetical protein
MIGQTPGPNRTASIPKRRGPLPLSSISSPLLWGAFQNAMRVRVGTSPQSPIADSTWACRSMPERIEAFVSPMLMLGIVLLSRSEPAAIGNKCG